MSRETCLLHHEPTPGLAARLVLLARERGKEAIPVCRSCIDRAKRDCIDRVNAETAARRKTLFAEEP